MKRGQQIIYVPNHILESIASNPFFAPGSLIIDFAEQSACEKGFVTSMNKAKNAAFCRYWSKYPPYGLRTLGNSELTPIANLVIQDTVPQIAVVAALEQIDNW